MKRKLWIIIIALALALLYVGYIILMVQFETPIRLNLTNRINLSSATQEIELPWYCRWISRYEWCIEGYDRDGKHYTEYFYTLPSIFESAEMNCIVCWDTGVTIAYIGESRAMYVIDLDFPSVDWK